MLEFLQEIQECHKTQFDRNMTYFIMVHFFQHCPDRYFKNMSELKQNLSLFRSVSASLFLCVYLWLSLCLSVCLSLRGGEEGKTK